MQYTSSQLLTQMICHQFFPHLCAPAGLCRPRHYEQLVVGQGRLELAPDPPHRQPAPLPEQLVVAGGEGQAVEAVQLQVGAKSKWIFGGSVLLAGGAD